MVRSIGLWSDIVDWLEDSPKPPPERITLTLPVVNASRQIAFVTAGAGKAEKLKEVLETESDLPSARVKCASGVHWFMDKPAASFRD